MSQSPIDIQTNQSLRLQDPKALFEIHYPDQKYPGQLKRSGHPVFELDEPQSGPFPEVSFRGYLYQLAQLHIHDHQEHVIDKEEEQALEIHFVHIPKGSSLKGTPGKSAPDPKVVLGILFKPDGLPDKSTSKSLFSFLKGDTPQFINPLDFFPSIPNGPEHWFHYEGSLTGPPFTENVSWFVLKEPGNVTKEEFAQILGAKQTARGLQPLDRRLVVRSF